jgi:hypothetical protein
MPGLDPLPYQCVDCVLVWGFFFFFFLFSLFFRGYGVYLMTPACLQSNWSAWVGCDVCTAGSGLEARTRSVLVAPTSGGQPCDPSVVQQRVCQGASLVGNIAIVPLCVSVFVFGYLAVLWFSLTFLLCVALRCAKASARVGG